MSIQDEIDWFIGASGPTSHVHHWITPSGHWITKIECPLCEERG